MVILFAALLAGTAAGHSHETIQYRKPEALVVDDKGKPLFRAPRDFLLQISGNVEGRVLDYDPSRRSVRVSAHHQWWLPCSQLQPQPICADPRKRPTRAADNEEAPPLGDLVMELEARGVPQCPGDPRCPTGN